MRGIDRARTIRGALAGTLAAAVWAAQQPLDQRVFGLRYDDTELLGKAVTGRSGWRAIGVALHLQNGAIFGAIYANVAPSLPVPRRARGPLSGVGEHLCSWPLTALVGRIHPAREEMPVLWGSGRAFAQAAWRHLLFGAILGELEAWLNRGEEAEEEIAPTASSNGYGNLDTLATAAHSA